MDKNLYQYILNKSHHQYRKEIEINLNELSHILSTEKYMAFLYAKVSIACIILDFDTIINYN